MALSRIIKLVVFAVATCFGLYVAPLLISFEYLKDGISKKFAQDIGLDVKILGDVEARFFPSTVISINQVRLDLDENNKIEIPKLDLNTNIASFLINNFKIQDIEIIGAQFSLELMERLANLPNSGFLGNLKFNNISLVIDQSARFLNKINNISGDLKYYPGKLFGFNGVFNLNNMDYTLSMNLVSSKDASNNASSFHMSSGFSDVRFDGDFSAKGTQYGLNGKVKVKLFDNIKSDIENKEVKQALLKEDLLASSDITINSKEISLANIAISSKNISKILGNFVLKFGSTNEISSSLEGDAINLDGLLGNLDNAGAEISLEKVIADFLLAFNFHLPPNLSGQLGFQLKEMTYNKKSIKNLAMSADFLEDKVSLKELLMEMPGKSTLRFEGIISHNQIRPKFDGKMLLDVKNYDEFEGWLKLDNLSNIKSKDQSLVVTSDIVIVPRNMRLHNAKFIWGDLKALGKFSFRHIGEKRLSTQANIRINYIDADAAKWPAKVDDFLGNLYASDFEKNGVKFYEITNDFKWLRNFPINLNANLIIDRFKYKDIIFPGFYIASNISPNNFAIEQMEINSDGAAITGAVSLSTSAIAPKVTTNLVVNKMTSEFINKIMPSDSLLITKQTELIAKNPDTQATVIVGGANFYGIHNISGDFKLRIKDYKSESLSFQNLNLSAQSQEGIINIESLNSDIFKGKLDAVVNVVIASSIPVYSATFAFNNIQLAEFLRYYAGSDKLNGYVSLNGNFSAKGADRNTAYANLNGSLSLIAKKVVWSGFDIGEIVRLGDYSSSFADKEERFKYFTGNGQSVFDDMSGNIKINGGVATLDDFKFSNTRISGAYAAKVDLKNKLISSFTKINFIPYGRAATMTLDISGSGLISELNPNIAADNYLRFLQDNATSYASSTPASPLLRNR